jgi:hypothetical protein
MTRFYTIVLALLLSSCGIFRGETRFTQAPRLTAPASASPGSVSVHFLGTGGIYLQGEGITHPRR